MDAIAQLRTTFGWFCVLGIILGSENALALMIYTFKPTPDGTGTIVAAEGAADIRGLPREGSHGIEQTTLYKGPDFEAFLSITGSLQRSYRVGDAVTLFDVTDDFLLSGDHRDPTKQTGDSFGITVSPGVGRTAIVVPFGFSFGEISGSMTFDGVELTSLNVQEQRISWGPGEDQGALIQVIPEPSTGLLLGLGVVAVAGLHQRRRL